MMLKCGPRDRPVWDYIVPLDPSRCHCGGRLTPSTDGNGHAVQSCDSCHARSSVLRIPAALFSEPGVQVAPAADLKPCACGRGPVKTATSEICLACDLDAHRASARIRRARNAAKSGARSAGRAA